MAACDASARTVREEVLGRGEFKPIKISSGRPRFTVLKYGIIFNVGAVKALGLASHVRLSINEEQNELMVSRCDADDEFAVEIHVNGNRGARLYSRDLQALIARLVGFNEKTGSVRVEGRRVPGRTAVIFDLKEVRRSGKM